MSSFREKTKALLLFMGISLFVAASLMPSAEGKIPPQYQKWLDEEVVYIISPLEREVFLKLTMDRERDLFIEAFWKHRDPIPATPENEFKTEHYRRINYANHFFGREGPKPGWKTDRGRVYIILGEPNDIQRFEGKTQTYPSEVWFYQGKTDVGLPAGFNLVFYQQGGVGEYKLYSPAKDGPQALLTSYYGDPLDYLGAYTKLKEIEPDLADVSISLVPGEETTMIGRPSMASDLLIQRVETTAQRMIEERYARKFLEYKDIVEVEYTANYIDNESLIKVIKDSSGLYFVHFSIEPGRLSMNQYEKKYYTTLKMNGSVSSLEGKSIYQFERVISLDFDAEKMASVSRRPFNIYDMFPLIPGNFRLSIIVKNEISKEFTSLEQTLSVPSEEAALQMTSLILGYRVARQETNQGNLKPFRLGPFQIYCQPNRVFLNKDSLCLGFQIHGLDPETKGKAEVRYAFLKNDEAFRSFSRKVVEYAELPNVLEEFSLAEFAPAHYGVRVSLVVDGREIVYENDEFDVTHLESVSRPWFYSKVLSPSSDPIYDYLVGTELYNAGQIDAAIVRLESACQRRPDSADFAQNLAQAYMVKGEYKKIEPLLVSFFSQEKPPKYELFFLLGKAYQNRGEWEKAIKTFDQTISHYGTNTNILNAVGECYFQKGDAKAALAVWEKSLEINPDQPQIRKNVETLKGKNEK